MLQPLQPRYLQALPEMVAGDWAADLHLLELDCFLNSDLGSDLDSDHYPLHPWSSHHHLGLAALLLVVHAVFLKRYRPSARHQLLPLDPPLASPLMLLRS